MLTKFHSCASCIHICIRMTWTNPFEIITMLISATKAALSLCTLLILAVGAFGERRSPWQVRPVERTQPSEGRAEPHHFQEIKFKAVKKHKTKQKKQPWDNSPDMCRLKGAGGRLDVNLPARGSGTKWTNPSEGDRIDLAVYRRSQQQERLCGSERGRLCWGVQVGWHNTFQRVKTQTGVCVCVCVCPGCWLTVNLVNGCSSLLPCGGALYSRETNTESSVTSRSTEHTETSTREGDVNSLHHPADTGTKGPDAPGQR